MNTLSYLLGDTGGAFNLLGCIALDLALFFALIIAGYLWIYDGSDDRLPFDDEDEDDDEEGGENK